MAALITFAAAKAQLRITDADHDEEIQAAADEASATVVDYLKGRADPTWTEITVPLVVLRAIKVLLTHFYEHPGDDMKADADVWQAVERLLMRHRDPTLA